MTENLAIKEVKPDLMRRTSGGWIATSPSKCGISIGVTAPTEDEAIERFRSEFPGG